jgi:rhodanese-related sulfurtransferase
MKFTNIKFVASLSLLLACMLLFVAANADIFPLRKMFPQVNIISTKNLHNLYDLNKVVVIDVRSPMEYNVIHLNKATNIPFADKDFLRKVDKIASKNSTYSLIFYCNGTTCAKSYRAAAAAQRTGLKNIYTYDAGVMDWAKNYPKEAVLLDETPINLANLISENDFQAKLVSFTKFKTAADKNNGVIIDLRDNVQRKYTLGDKLKNIQSISFNKMVALLKAGKYKKQNLFIFDAVGKQVRWLQYYLQKYGYKNYWFLKGGARSVIKSEQHW